MLIASTALLVVWLFLFVAYVSGAWFAAVVVSATVAIGILVWRLEVDLRRLVGPTAAKVARGTILTVRPGARRA